MTWNVLGWAIAIFIPLVFTLIFSLTFGRKAYAAEERSRYSFLIHFPYELYGGHTPQRHLARVLIYVFCGFDALACALPLIFLDFHPSLLSLAIMVFVFGILKNIALAIMVSVPAYEFKPHLISFTAFGGAGVLQSVLGVLFFINRFTVSEGVALTFAIVVGAVGLSAAIALANPRLSKWTKLDAVIDEDGAITTSRPRPFPLAFTQWILILLSGLMTLLISIGLIVLLVTVI